MKNSLTENFYWYYCGSVVTDTNSFIVMYFSSDRMRSTTKNQQIRRPSDSPRTLSVCVYGRSINAHTKPIAFFPIQQNIFSVALCFLFHRIFALSLFEHGDRVWRVSFHIFVPPVFVAACTNKAIQVIELRNANHFIIISIGC